MPRESEQARISVALDSRADRQLPLHIEQETATTWNIVRSDRARRFCARVHRDGRVDIVVPRRATAIVIDEFIERHRAWIERKVALARQGSPLDAAFPPTQIVLSALGQTLRVHLAGGRHTPRVRLVNDKLLVICGNTADRTATALALRRWLMAHARDQLGALLAQAARDHGFSYRSVSVRRQRTRWGSCSARHAVSLNVSLLFQPSNVMNYLLIHELSHTIHLNHSVAFWDTVARHCPQWRQLDRLLLQGWRRVPHWVYG